MWRRYVVLCLTCSAWLGLLYFFTSTFTFYILLYSLFGYASSLHVLLHHRYLPTYLPYLPHRHVCFCFVVFFLVWDGVSVPGLF